MQFPATPGWGPPAVVVCGSPPLLARACRLQWGLSWVGVSLVVCVSGVCGCARWPCCVVCCVFVVSALLMLWCGGAAWVCPPRALVCSVACGWCAGGLCFVVPALLVGACGWCWCGCGWCVVCVPRHSWLRDLGAVPRHSWLGSAVVWWWLVPCHSWLGGLIAGPRHSWLGFAARCGGWFLATPGLGPWAWFPATPGWGPPVVVVGARSPLLAVNPRLPFSLALVCVCVCCVALRVVVGGVQWSCAVWSLCVCVCVRAVCGFWGVSQLGWFSSSVGMVVVKKQKKSKRRGPVDV